MSKQQLANRVWNTANEMRSSIDAGEYKDYILGFVFYKYLSENEVAFMRKQDWDDEDIREDLNEEKERDAEFIKNEIDYFISYECLFSTWINLAGLEGDINSHGRPDALKETIDKDKARAFFEGVVGRPLRPCIITRESRSILTIFVEESGFDVRAETEKYL